MREPLARFSGFPVVACAHSPSFDALRLGVGCGLGSETPPQDVLSSHSTPERQSLFESHRQRRWLTRWSYKYRLAFPASITAPATPFCFWTTQKHLTIERIMGSRAEVIILSGRKWPAR